LVSHQAHSGCDELRCAYDDDGDGDNGDDDDDDDVYVNQIQTLLTTHRGDASCVSHHHLHCQNDVASSVSKQPS